MGLRATLILVLFSFAMKPVPPIDIKLPFRGTYPQAIKSVPAGESFSNLIHFQASLKLNSKKRAKPEEQKQILTGIVEWEYKPFSWDCDTPNCDHFALYDDVSRNNYELDDARTALPFEGKRVRVIGVLNSRTGTIHVIFIEALK